MLNILRVLINRDASTVQLVTETFQDAKDLNICLNLFVTDLLAYTVMSETHV